ncbi:aldehyde dehydrogenase family protein [Paracoccus beibuensis]|uniref:aldehyde dehydrogenase family protein n=1 Tax=Paracoccus beibuensis TaxID=547602 RepID=UPI003898E291
MDEAVEWIMFGIFLSHGEVCATMSRVLIEQSIHEPLLERLGEEAGKIRIGHGLDEDVLLDPLVSSSQHEKMLEVIERGKTEGRLVAGGSVPAGLESGCYVKPTIFADMAEDRSIWCEKIFGPVVRVKPFETEADAIRMDNDSRFGLGAAVMSADLDRAERMARRFRAGIIWINCSQRTFTEALWGGYKKSGIGRKLGERA